MVLLYLCLVLLGAVFFALGFLVRSFYFGARWSSLGPSTEEPVSTHSRSAVPEPEPTNAAAYSPSAVDPGGSSPSWRDDFDRILAGLDGAEEEKGKRT